MWQNRCFEVYQVYSIVGVAWAKLFEACKGHRASFDDCVKIASGRATDTDRSGVFCSIEYSSVGMDEFLSSVVVVS